jgi:hypothetical protein
MLDPFSKEKKPSKYGEKPDPKGWYSYRIAKHQG